MILVCVCVWCYHVESSWGGVINLFARLPEIGHISGCLGSVKGPEILRAQKKSFVGQNDPNTYC